MPDSPVMSTVESESLTRSTERASSVMERLTKTMPGSVAADTSACLCARAGLYNSSRKCAWA